MGNELPILILGAGATGLGAAHRLGEKGLRDFLVLEREEYPGGLAASFRDEQGFTWDIGGHVLFSKHEAFHALMDDLLGPDGWLEHDRRAFAWMRGRFVPYPVQCNLRHLEPETRERCVRELERRAPDGKQAGDFRGWILATFGETLAKEFFLPYNFKVWAYPPERLSCGWIGDRVALPRPRSDDSSWGPNHRFRYPRAGGTGGIWRALADRIGKERIRYGAIVEKIDVVERAVVLASGEKIPYLRLLSTLPLDRLCALAGDGLSRRTRESASRLLHSSSNIVGIGLRGNPPEDLRERSWIYFPEGDCPFYRVTLLSSYNPDLVPSRGEFWSLLTETSSSPERPILAERLIEETIEGLLSTGMIRSRSEIVSTWKHTAEYGYPTPSLERDEILAQVLPELESRGISSRGRFGLWKYELSNQDHCLMQGAEWAESLPSATR